MPDSGVQRRTRASFGTGPANGAFGVPAAELDWDGMLGSYPRKGARLRSVEPTKSEMLCRLQRGEIALGEYLDFSAALAVEHLKGRVDPERLQFIRSMIRDRLTSDPVAVHYLKQATGVNPDGHKAS